MSISRRDLGFLLPAMAAAAPVGVLPTLNSKAYAFDDLPVRTNATGTMKSRAVFNGMTTRGQHMTMHVSELAPGQSPHPPERQPHEEVIIIREGTLEVTLNGQKSVLGPGSIVYSAYDSYNGWKNVGLTTAQYYVISLEEHS
jgi:quercetin dioxygenase-like cupin family protein